MTLTDFLLARIAEDEAGARAASPGPWRIAGTDDERDDEDTWPGDVLAVDGIKAAESFALTDRQQFATAGHIARHDPARVLAECEAKRRIVELCDGFDEQGREVRQLLALPYADHPDYREEWKP